MELQIAVCARVMASFALFGALVASPPTFSEEQDASGLVEEIIVTTKRGDVENVQEMAEAVTAFVGPALEREFAVTLEDLNHAVPNVQLELRE